MLYFVNMPHAYLFQDLIVDMLIYPSLYLSCTNILSIYYIMWFKMNITYAYTNKSKMTMHFQCISGSVDKHTTVHQFTLDLSHRLNICYNLENK